MQRACEATLSVFSSCECDLIWESDCFEAARTREFMLQEAEISQKDQNINFIRSQLAPRATEGKQTTMGLFTTAQPCELESMEVL